MTTADAPADLVTVGAARDVDGYVAIGDYAVIGDGRSVALIASDGSVDWWPVPRLDSPPAFAAVLDPAAGGRFTLRPADPDARVDRRYLPDTNVLETTYRTSTGTAVVLDSLNSGNAGTLPWNELARRVDGTDGEVAFELDVAPGNGLGEWTPWAEADERGVVLHAGDVSMGVQVSDVVTLETGRADARSTFTVRAGERVVVGLVATFGRPLFLTSVDSIDARLDRSVEAWQEWSAQVVWPGADRDRVVRSALALKLLLMSSTGAIAAAATTSLPESIGGPKNWDYRYCWVRDAVLTVDALSACGMEEEVHAAVSWLLMTIREHGPDVHVMYTLDGAVTTASRHADVPGYRGSRPVQIGNDATSQFQLGIYGDLFGTVADWVFGGHVLDVRSARELADLADRCADVWHRDDAGIWELQQDRPYTVSKMNCWRALDAAARLTDAGHIAGPADRWRREADLIREWVQKHCWSERKQAYSFYAGSDDLDASVLLGARFGFDTGPRMASTVDAVAAELGEPGGGPLVYRYTGVHREEETFLACAYWVVQALAFTGRTEDAADRMRALDRAANPLGLLAEMSTPGSFNAMGNLPQALSHLSLINAATVLRDATDRTNT